MERRIAMSVLKIRPPKLQRGGRAQPARVSPNRFRRGNIRFTIYIVRSRLTRLVAFEVPAVGPGPDQTQLQHVGCRSSSSVARAAGAITNYRPSCVTSCGSNLVVGMCH